ncbi:AAA family ATPase [Brachybacterium tyrofermentans]|uniref:AAA family ATPase n=1 Tax=Brachybacterium tyrofermentans TaxID=47848 RepID=UPI003FD07C26
MNAHTKLLNAFLPATSMNDPDRFAGRATQVKALTNALNTTGSVPLIYGQRGLGKSSIAVQMQRIAQSDNSLLGHLSAEALALPEDKQAIAFYVTCQDSTQDLHGLLSAMINAVEKLQFEEANPKRGKIGPDYKLVDRSTKTSISIKFVSHERMKSYRESTQERDLSSLSLSERLVELADLLTHTYKQPVIFFIDELDRLAGVHGLASFLKANSSPALKFVLVGIGVTESELLSDHLSLGRQLTSVKIPTMEPEELESIVQRTVEYLAEHDLPYRFSDDASSELAKIAAGFPWFVHVIGQTALAEAEESGNYLIGRADIERAVNMIGENQMAQTYSDLYQRAVQDSPRREIVLRLFARWPEVTIPTSEVYGLAASLGVIGAATYTGHLLSEEYGKTLARPPIQKRALYYFADPMFKVYARMRPSFYEEIDEKVESATEHWQ